MSKHPKPPCKAFTLLGWFRDVQVCTEKRVQEWCDLFRLSKRDRLEMSTRYGDRLIGFTTFVNFWTCRDLPIAKKPNYTPPKPPLIGPRDRIFSSDGKPWEEEDDTTLIDDLMAPGFKELEGRRTEVEVDLYSW